MLYNFIFTRQKCFEYYKLNFNTDSEEELLENKPSSVVKKDKRRNRTRKRKKVDVRAIEFDWVFNK